MYPVRSVVLPADLRGVKPGELPKELLREVKPHGWLHHLAADAYHALRSAAIGDGIKPFKPTSAGDTYRSIAMQRAGFLQRYQTEMIMGASTRQWDGRTWYLKPGFAPMAAPGTSNHNLGIAVDIHTASGERLAWMLKNCARFGWSWEVQSEPWHIRYVAGDAVPDAVKAWKEANG
jgi:LAS superfamily LD-carboxypeptidase LdcB